jgi:regulator of chromosome condensation
MPAKRKADDDVATRAKRTKPTTTAPVKAAKANGASKPVAKPKAEPKATTTAKATKVATATKTAKATKAKTPIVAPEESKEELEHPKGEPEIAAVEDDETPKKSAAAKPAKAPKTAAPAKKAATKTTIGKKINDAPTDKLDIYVFGEGSSGELGLGSRKVDGKKPIDVKRPRINQNLAAKTVGVVQIACGGMHAAALTHDNKILTWGVNDQGALGRDTTWAGGLRDMDNEESSDDEDEDDTGINPMESTPKPMAVEHLPESTKFVQVVAGDSATFALTDDGKVYGCGTFRVSNQPAPL